jgi:hypothetical protein
MPPRPHTLADATARYGYTPSRARKIRAARALGVYRAGAWWLSTAELDRMVPGPPGNHTGRPRRAKRNPL